VVLGFEVSHMNRVVSLAALVGPLVLMPALAQDKKGDPTTYRIVKYDGLKDVILKNRGKVLFVEFWADF
jgi:hypothetical protein